MKKLVLISALVMSSAPIALGQQAMAGHDAKKPTAEDMRIFGAGMKHFAWVTGEILQVHALGHG